MRRRLRKGREGVGGEIDTYYWGRERESGSMFAMRKKKKEKKTLKKKALPSANYYEDLINTEISHTRLSSSNVAVSLYHHIK